MFKSKNNIFTIKRLCISNILMVWFISQASFTFAGPAQGGLPIPTNSLPSGGQVAQGQANITQSNAVMNINQSSQNAVINWKSFDVGSQAQVNFNQPSANSATLNRVQSATPSMIDGAVRANGQVAFVNPNGIIFGPNAQVDAGGIVASTLDVADKEFMARGKMSFKGNGTGKIINQGSLKASGSNAYVALMAPEVQNQGVIAVQHSSSSMVAIAGGKQITLEVNGSQLLGVKVDESAYKTLIDNQKLIDVGNGTLIIAANSVNNLMASVVKNSGTIIANSISENGGRILLTGSKIEQSGTIQANSQNAQAGSITFTAENIDIAQGSLTQALGNSNTGVIRLNGINQSNIQIAGQVQSSGAILINLPENLGGKNIGNGIQNALNITDIKNYLNQIDLSQISKNGTQLNITTTAEIQSPSIVSLAALTMVDGNLNTQITPAVMNPTESTPAYFQALPVGQNTSNTTSPWIALFGGSMIVNGRISAFGVAGVSASRGRIQLNAQQQLLLLATGQIIARGEDGGEVILRSEQGDVKLQGLIQTNGGSGRGGTILGYGYQTTWIDGATISADGLLQGGDIRLGIDQPSLADRAYLLSDGTGGGSTQGPPILSQLTIIGNQSTLSATATHITGLGGVIETSGHQLSVQDIQITVTKNNVGNWLLDPTDIIIASLTGADSTKTYILDSTIINSINNGTNVNILATNSINQNVDLSFNNATINPAILTYDIRSGNTSGFIDINGNISNSGSGFVSFKALTQGGQVRLGANKSINLNGLITFNDQTTQLQINASQLTISKTYNANVGFILSNFVMGINSSINSKLLTLSNHQNASSQVNTYAVGDIFGTNTTTDLVINPAVLTVTGTTSPTKTYDGTISATITGGTLSGLVAADTSDVVLVQSGAFAFANAGSNISITMNNSLSGSAANNYTLTQPTVTGTINKAILSLSGEKTFDGTATFTSGQMTIGGGVNSEVVAITSSYTNSSAGAATYANAIPTGITWSVTGGNALATNYILPTTASFTINKASLTITAKDDAKVYGTTSTTQNNVIYHSTGDASLISSKAFTTSGTLFGTDQVLSISLSSSGALATATSTANGGGLYAITPSTASGTGLSNYTINYVNGAMTVNQAPLTIQALNDAKVYGATTTSSNGITYTGSTAVVSGGVGYTVQGLVNSHTLTNVTLTSNGVLANASVASSPYAITPSAAQGPNNTLGNYTINYLPADSGMVVSKANLTITASDQSTTYGTALVLPTSSGFTTSTLVGGDSVTSTTIKFNNISSTVPATTLYQSGGYVDSLVVGNATGTGLSNYNITYASGTLTVNKKDLYITANNQTITYGPSWKLGYAEFTATGLVNTDNVNKVALTQSGVSTVPANQAAGTYSGSNGIVVTSGSAVGTGLSNYNIVYNQSTSTNSVQGTLTIDKAPLTISANNRSITYGDGLILGTSAFSTSGLMGVDSLTSVALTQNTNTSVPSTQNAGTYSGGGNEIIITPLSSGTIFSNYAITYQPGTLTISPKQLSVSAIKEYDGNTNFSVGQVSITGTVGGQTLNLSGSGVGNSANVVGISSMITGGLTLANGTSGTIGLASNYALPISTTQAMITPKNLTVGIVNNPTKIYDGGQVATLGSSNYSITGFVGTQLATINQTTGLYAAPDVLGSNASNVSAILNAANYSATSGTGFVPSNYLLPLSATGTGTINKATLTITAYSGWKYVGQSDPSFTNNYYVTGGVNGSNPVASATVTRTNSGVTTSGNNHELPGIYNNALVPSSAVGTTATILNNYNVNYANNIFTIVDKNQIVITTNSNQINYGSANTPATLPDSPVISAQYCVTDCTIAGNIKTLTLIYSAQKQNNGNIRVPNGLINTTVADLKDTAGGNGTISVTVGQDELQMENAKSSSGYYKAGTYGYQMASSVPTISGTIVTLNTTQNTINESTSTTPTSSTNSFSGFYNFLGTLTIAPKTITPTANTISKVYDGTVLATPSLSFTAGKITNDVVYLNSPYSTFASKNVLAASSYTSTGLFLSGTDAGNYILSATSVTNNTSTITKAPILVAGLQASDKTYNGSTDASVTGASNSRLITPFKGDTVSLSASSDTLNCSSACTFDTANVYTNKPVTVTQGVLQNNFSLSGTDAGNYEISGVAVNLSANIFPAPLYVSGLSAQNKIYNANTTAVITQGTPTVTGTVYGGDSISQFSTIGTFGGTGTFATQNVGTGITVTPNLGGLGLSGTHFSNYYLAGTSSPLTANITQAPLYLSGLSVTSKTYDANVYANLTGTISIASGVQGSDVLTLSGIVNSGTYINQNVGIGKSVTADLSGLNVKGSAASNYYLSDYVISGNISAAPVTFSGTKIYNGSLSFDAGQLTVKGVNSEVLSLANSGTLTTNSANVGGVSSISAINNLTLQDGSGSKASNYTLSNYAMGLLSITAAPITIQPQTITKIYDGSTSATTYFDVTSGTLYTNASNGNTADSMSATFNYANKNVGSENKVVTASNLVVNDGNSGKNYTVTLSSNTVSSITPKDLIITPNNVSKTYATNDPSLTYSYGALASGDTSSIFTGSLLRTGTSATQLSTSLSSEAVGTYLVGIGSLSASNYNLILSSSDKYLTINKYITPIYVTAVAKTKVYGTNDPNLTYTYTGFVTNVTVDGVTINDNPVGGNNPFTGSLLRVGTSSPGVSSTLSNEVVGTYQINQGSLLANAYDIQYTGAYLTITKAPLVVTANSQSKTYGDFDPSLTYITSGVINGLVNGVQISDTISSVLSGSLTRVAGETVASSPYRINQGTLVSNGNYQLSYNYNNLTINKANLTAFGTQVYNGTTLFNAGSFTSVTGVNGETFTVSSGNATLASKNVQTSQNPTTLNSIVLASANGSLTSNYNTLTAAQTSLTVTPASYTAITGTKVYDGTSGIINNATLTGVNGETFTVSATANSLNVVDASKFTAIGTSLSANTNYVATSVNSILSGTSNNRASITVASLNIVANDQSTIYGTSLSLGTTAFSASGLKNNEQILGVTLTQGGNTTVPRDQNAATYSGNVNGILPSNPKGNLLLSNYQIRYTPGALTINPKVLTITGNDTEVTSGNKPTFTFNVTGFINPQDANNVLITGSLVTPEGTLPGTYEIGIGDLKVANNPNYIINTSGYKPAKFTIRPAPTSPVTPSNQGATKGLFVDQNSVSIIAEIKHSTADEQDQDLNDVRSIGNSKMTAYDGTTRLNLSIDVGNDYSGLHPETLPAVDNIYSFN